jgi:hypothetical protein
VFYGDDMAVNGDFEHATPFTGWADIETPTTSEVNTSTVRNGTNSWKLIGDAENDGIYQQLANQVAGRQYYSEVYVYITAGAVKLDVNGVALGNTATTGSWVKLSGTTTFASNATFTIRQHGSTAATWFVDDCSHKEVGVASGWTDADQQLHIPQTALQSYNELAWMNGFDDGTDSDISCGSDASIDDIFDGGGTFSGWILPNGDGAGGYGRIFDKSNNYFYLQSESGSTAQLAFTSINATANTVSQTTNNDITYGQWYHIVLTYNSTTPATQPVIYINGVATAVTESTEGDGTRTSDAAASLTLGNNSSGTRGFEGCITEASFWEEILTATEILELYNDGKALDATSHSQADELKAYWRNNGLSTWTDLSTNSNDGTVNNITETILIPQGVDSTRDAQGFIMNKQKSTSCLNLTNGFDVPYVDLGSETIVAADDAVSFSVWLKPDDLGVNYFLGKGASTDYIAIWDASTVKYRADNATVVFSVGTFVPGDWTHLTLVKAGGGTNEISVYLNGVLNGTASTDTETSNEPFDYRYIGAMRDSSDSFRGSVDGFLIYNKALDGTEILKNYKATKGNHRN